LQNSNQNVSDDFLSKRVLRISRNPRKLCLFLGTGFEVEAFGASEKRTPNSSLSFHFRSQRIKPLPHRSGPPQLELSSDGCCGNWRVRISSHNAQTQARWSQPESEPRTIEGRERFMTGTYWTLYIFAVASLVAFMVMRRSGQISKKEAAGYVKSGAVVVDVRSPHEFSSGHLSQAFNMPLDEIEGLLPQKVRDKNRVILVHCRTGLRSKKAKLRLQHIGYKNVFILGSYERAFKIVSGRML
jgi:phage shock protein E